MSNSNKKNNTKKKEEVNLEELKKPWIQQKTGLRLIIGISIGLMVLVSAQIIIGTGDWGRGILYGALFGGSIWLVFYGMNWFHSLFRTKDK